MKKIFIILICTLTGCAWIQPRDYTDKFRVGGATGADLGSVGKVEGDSIFGGDNVYFRLTMPTLRDIETKVESKFTFSDLNFSDTDIKASVEAEIANKFGITADANGEYHLEKNFKGEFVILSILEPAKAILQINESLNKATYDQIKYSGDRSRIVHKVLLALNLDDSKKLFAGETIKADVNVPINVGGTPIRGNIDLSLKQKNESSIALDSPTIIGYSWAIPCWEKTGNSIKLATLEYQKYGVSVDCGKLKSDPADYN